MTADVAPIARTPEPSYVAVIFTSLRRTGDGGYERMAQRMVELASQQPGFLGVESARGEDGLGITVSYWKDEEAVRAWKAQSEHEGAQALGRERFYTDYRVRVALVLREYGKD